MKWWDDLWLNESFATYMAYKALDHFWPEWKVWDQYVTDTVFEAMGLDSLKSSHPIKMKVKHISEIDELFDEIAYEKGGSILRMLNLYLGELQVRKELSEYIETNLYKNAEAKDLWNSIQSASNQPILGLMQKYIEQVGFPEVKVKLQNNHLQLSQERFLYESGQDEKELWLVPVALNYNKKYLLRQSGEIINTRERVKFLNVNKDYSGFFISNYSIDLQNQIGKNISSLKTSEKLGLIHDFFALVRAGDKDLSDFYKFINSYFSEERSPVVLHYLIAKLTAIYLLINDKVSKKLAIKFAKRSLDEIVGYTPKKSENIVETYLRVIALSTLALLEDPNVKKFAHDQFLNYLKNEESIHPDLRSVIFTSAIWFDERNYQVIKKDYEKSHVQEEKAKFLGALGFSKNKAQIKETLQYILSQKVPFAFLPYGISSIARNPYAREIALKWLMKNWPDLVKRSGGLVNMLLRRVLQAIIPISGIGKEKEVVDFLKKNKTKGLEKSIDQVLEELRINAKFVKLYKN